MTNITKLYLAINATGYLRVDPNTINDIELDLIINAFAFILGMIIVSQLTPTEEQFCSKYFGTDESSEIVRDFKRSTINKKHHSKWSFLGLLSVIPIPVIMYVSHLFFDYRTTNTFAGGYIIIALTAISTLRSKAFDRIAKKYAADNQQKTS